MTKDILAINTARFLSVDAIQKANSGHPGLPMGAAPTAFTLWAKEMLNFTPKLDVVSMYATTLLALVPTNLILLNSQPSG